MLLGVCLDVADEVVPDRVEVDRMAQGGRVTDAGDATRLSRQEMIIKVGQGKNVPSTIYVSKEEKENPMIAQLSYSPGSIPSWSSAHARTHDDTQTSRTTLLEITPQVSKHVVLFRRRRRCRLCPILLCTPAPYIRRIPGTKRTRACTVIVAGGGTPNVGRRRGVGEGTSPARGDAPLTSTSGTHHADRLLLRLRLRWSAPVCIPGRSKLTKGVRGLDGLGWGGGCGRCGKEGENVLFDVLGWGLGCAWFGDGGCMEVEGEEVVFGFLLLLWLLWLRLRLGGCRGDLDAPSDSGGKELSGLGVRRGGILAERGGGVDRGRGRAGCGETRAGCVRSTGRGSIKEGCSRSGGCVSVESGLFGGLEDGWIRGGRSLHGPPSRFVFRTDKGFHFAVGRR